MRSIEERLERLERENRWLRRGGATAAAVLSAALLLGQDVPRMDSMEARRLAVVDKTGAVRIELTAEPDGPARLNVYKKGGAAAAQIEVQQNGLSLIQVDNGGVAKLGVSQEGSPFVAVRDAKGNQIFRAP